MNNTFSINNKTEAADYFSLIFSNTVQSDPELLKKAASYFSEEELLCTSFAPPHKVENCFPGFAKTCGIDCECSH